MIVPVLINDVRICKENAIIVEKCVLQIKDGTKDGIEFHWPKISRPTCNIYLEKWCYSGNRPLIIKGFIQ